MINYIKDTIFKINSFFYLCKTHFFETEKLLNDLKMRDLENKQKQDLIDSLLFKLNPVKDIYEPNSNIEDGLIINPIWQMAVYNKDRKIVTGMPLLFWVHSHLKNYGFNPDYDLRSSDVKVRISMDVGKYVQFPLYIKGRNLPEGERLENVPPNIGEIDRGN